MLGSVSKVLVALLVNKMAIWNSGSKEGMHIYTFLRFLKYDNAGVLLSSVVIPYSNPLSSDAGTSVPILGG